MKATENDSELNKKRGLRLKECREYRKLTQEKFAEEYGKSTTYLSMLECGQRTINWNKAQELADILSVNPAYIMLESDNMLRGQHSRGYEEFGSIDESFIRFLIASEHTISFCVVVLYDGKKPNEKTLSNGLTVTDWNSLKLKVQMNDLKEFSLSDNHCMLQTENGLSECLITDVCIDGTTMTYGHFVYHIYRLYDYINFTINSLKDFEADIENLNADDEIAQMEVEDSRYTKSGIYPSEQKMFDEAMEYLINKDKQDE